MPIPLVALLMVTPTPRAESAVRPSFGVMSKHQSLAKRMVM